MSSSLLSSVLKRHPEEPKKQGSDDIHTDRHEFPLPCQSLVKRILRSTKANISDHIQCWPEFVTIQRSLVSHVPFLKQPLDTRSPIWVTQRLNRTFYCLGPAYCLLLILLDWAFSQTRTLTWSSIHCIVKRLLSCYLPMVSAVHWLTETPAFLAQTWTCRVGSWIRLVSAMTDLGNQKASNYIFGSQWWSMIE